MAMVYVCLLYSHLCTSTSLNKHPNDIFCLNGSVFTAGLNILLFFVRSL